MEFRAGFYFKGFSCFLRTSAKRIFLHLIEENTDGRTLRAHLHVEIHWKRYS